MNRALSNLKFAFLSIGLAVALTACGGGGGSAQAQVIGSGPNPGQSSTDFTQLTPQMQALIARRYSSSPDLQRAAEGWARAKGANMQSAVSTGIYNEGLSLKAANAHSCLLGRAERLGVPLTDSDDADFAAALTPTPEAFAAYWKTDRLASGHPKEFYGDEAPACAVGDIE